METDNIIIRIADIRDAGKLLAIYEPYVRETTVTFEYDVPTVEDFAGRIERTLRRYPYLVAELEGEPVGYAYASAFRTRAAYQWSAEASVYVRRDCHRLGIGRRLYTALERILRLQNVSSIAACISHPNRESIKFHSSLDYERVASFTKCAWKHGRWVDVIWMQKILWESNTMPGPFVPFPDIPAETVKELLI